MQEFNPTEYYKKEEEHAEKMVSYLKQFDKDKYLNNEIHSEISTPDEIPTIHLLQSWSYLVMDSFDIIVKAKRNCMRIEVTELKNKRLNCKFILEKLVSKTLENQIGVKV